MHCTAAGFVQFTGFTSFKNQLQSVYFLASIDVMQVIKSRLDLQVSVQVSVAL